MSTTFPLPTRRTAAGAVLLTGQLLLVVATLIALL